MGATRHDLTRRHVLVGSAPALALGAFVPSAAATALQMDRDLIDLLHAQEQALIDHYQATLDAYSEAAFREAGLPEAVRATIEEMLAAEEVHQAVVTRPDQPRIPAPVAIPPEDPLDALRRAADLENLAVAAYAFVIPELGRQRLIPDLLGIHSVEARHAAWLATMLGDDPFPAAIDAPLALGDADPAANEPPATPVPPASIAAEAELAPIVAAIADELNVAPEEVTVVSATPEIWPDASLGCPQPDMLYAQVVTAGFRVVVDAAGEEIEFHSDERGSVVRCP